MSKQIDMDRRSADTNLYRDTGICMAELLKATTMFPELVFSLNESWSCVM